MNSILSFINHLEILDINQAKTVKSKISTLSEEEIERLNEYLQFLEYYFEFSGKLPSDISTSWNNTVKIIVKEKFHFIKHQCYRCKTLDEAIEKVYNNADLMYDYNTWLLLSNLINYNHIRLFDFFKKHLNAFQGTNYLEIGPGHGLFFNEAIKSNSFSNYMGIDISETSLSMSRHLLEYQNRSPVYTLEELNLYDLSENTKYDFITCGEVLEHVEDPVSMIKKIYSLLSNDGIAYISTAVNSPAPDHIYLFQNILDVENILIECGLTLLNKIQIPLETFKYKNFPSITEYSVAYIVRK